MITKNWPRPIHLMLMAFATGSVVSISAMSAHADLVRIVSVNGTYDPNHADTINVQPGDLVTLSADLLDPNNSYQAEGQPVEDFNWSSDDRSGDACSGQYQGDCLGNSSFQFNDYGVSFYVPYTMGKEITISVSSTLSNAVDEAGYTSTDSIILVNESYSTPLPPVQVITDPAQYPAPVFDPVVAVGGQGRWVILDGVRYWIPYTYTQDNDDEWVPYQNGYWNWSDGYGYTWVSYDPWGWATDHYGCWRHHNEYGWMWLPFDDHHYEPHCVTFYDNDGYIGWYPYHDGWADGYRQRDEHGFDDGFWLGNDGCRGYGDRDHDYHWHQGFTSCPYDHFRESNIHDWRDRDDGRNRELVGGNRFGHYPGMFNDPNQSRTYVEHRAGGPLQDTHTLPVMSHGGASIMRPVQLRPTPVIYGGVSKINHIGARPTPVGTVYGVGKFGTPQGGIRPLPPTTNGRGIVAPPRATDPRSGTVSVLPPRAHDPAAPTRGNPIVVAHPIAAPIRAPQPVRVGAPVFHPVANPGRPGQPQPEPVRPGQPQQPAPVRPVQPQPEPVRPGQPQQPAPVRPVQPQPAPVRPVQPQPAPVRPAQPQPQPVRPQPAPPVYRPQPAPAPRPQPAPPVYHPQPAPAPRPQPAPPVYRPQPAPAPRPQPAPPVFRPAPQPAPRPAPGGGGRRMTDGDLTT